MRRLAVAFLACGVLCCAADAGAQTQPASLATLFEDIYGPNGLVLSSDDVQLDGTNHAAHFNSAFQSDFRLVNIALTSQLTAVPLPSPPRALPISSMRRPARSCGRPAVSARSCPIVPKPSAKRPARIRLLEPVFFLRSPRWRVARRLYRRCFGTTPFKPAAAAPTSSPRPTRSRQRSASSPAR